METVQQDLNLSTSLTQQRNFRFRFTDHRSEKSLFSFIFFSFKALNVVSWKSPFLTIRNMNMILFLLLHVSNQNIEGKGPIMWLKIKNKTFFFFLHCFNLLSHCLTFYFKLSFLCQRRGEEGINYFNFLIKFWLLSWDFDFFLF